MSEEETNEKAKEIVKGVVVEFDFAVADGAQLLFDVTHDYLDGIGIELDIKREAIHLCGGNVQGGLKELFESLDDKHSPEKAAREIGEKFVKALRENVADAFTPGFRDFVRTLNENGVKVVIASRAGADAIAAQLGDLAGDLVVPFTEMSTTYGNCKWDAWRRSVRKNGLYEIMSAAVTGSGAGVKSALMAGLCALGVVHPHTEWQDFGGADAVVEALDASAAQTVLRMLHMA